MRAHVYVDGESHYARSFAMWKNMHGERADLTEVVSNPGVSGTAAYPDSNRPHIRLVQRAKFFWDTHYPFLAPYPFKGRPIDGAVYLAVRVLEDGYHNIFDVCSGNGVCPGSLP